MRSIGKKDAPANHERDLRFEEIRKNRPFEKGGRVEHYRVGSDGRIYFVTMSVVEWLPIFIMEPTCRVITESLNYCHRSGRMATHAYVVMPTHLHTIVSFLEHDAEARSNVLHSVRKFTGRKLIGLAKRQLPRCFVGTLECERADRDHQFWQPSVHPVQIDSESFFEAKRRYIHENPCRKGLVSRPEHWRFSSASYWMEDPPRENDVILSPIVW